MEDQQDNILTVKLIKRDGKLVHTDSGNAAIYQEFVKNMKEGQQVQAFFEAFKDDGTNPQLAMIHACIRKLAIETGCTFDGMKLVIKKQAGLITGDHIKSFADCSKEELCLVIEAINVAGEMVNIHI